ncbi:hypothetical protein Tsubulata_025473, partial [Turnera subulata]
MRLEVMESGFLFSLLVLFFIFYNCSTILAQPSPAPAPPGPTNVTKILEKAGQFQVFIRLLKATQEDSTLNGQLNNTNNAITIFAPSDNAFSSLKSGTLNSLNDQEKAELVQFHIVPQYLSSSQFQTVSNPLSTQAGSGDRLELNVTTTGNSVNITTGLTNTSVSGTIYTDNQLAVYQVDQVLLPVDLFTPKPPSPAPAPEKSKKKASAATADSPDISKEASGAVSFMVHNIVVSLGIGQSPAAAPQAPPVVPAPQSPPVVAAPAQPPAAATVPPPAPATVPPPAPATVPPPASTPTQTAVPGSITNVTKILEKAGHFTIFIRLLRATQEENHLFSALNDSSSGITIFAPTDSAFSGLKSGTLNILSDAQKAELVKFHVVPTFLSTSQFQTVSNPLGTWAGTGNRLPLNVTSYPNSVNITSGLTNTSISGTVYTDGQLAIYRIEKVLLPVDIFKSDAPAPAPVAPAPEKPKKKAPAVESPVVPVDTSGAVSSMQNG